MWCYSWLVFILEFCLLQVQETMQNVATTTGGPYIMNGPQNKTAMSGQRLTFQCGAEAFPDNITYYWYKDGKDVRTLPVYNKRLTITDGTLLLTGVVKEDMGWYTCRPSNGIGQDEASAYLNVTYLPRVILNRMPVQVKWAKAFREKLDCPVDANPPLTYVEWTKGSSQIRATGRFDILLNGTLLVSRVEEGDAGTYFCTPNSVLGRGEISPMVQVIVRDPPYFTLRPEILYQRQMGQAVLMQCSASGTPPPAIIWMKDGDVVDLSPSRIQQVGGDLSIASTTKEDHGKYECVARNTIATIIAPTELRVLNTTPHAPYNVTVTPSLFSADISWAPAYNGGKPQFYMLWFRKVGGEWGQLTIPTQSTTFTMYNLRPNTDYEFMVLSRNEIGNGSYSEPVRATTLGYDPDLVTALPTDASGATYIPSVTHPLGPRPSPPRNVTAVLATDHSVLVTWMPSASHSPVPVFWYDVDFRSPPGANQAWQRFGSHVRNSPRPMRVRLDELPPGTYEVRVVAFGVLSFKAAPSVVVEVPAEGRLIPDAMIGGIVGGVLFLLVAVLLTTMAIIHSRRKDSKSRNAAANYDVSYGKPEDVNSKSQQTPPKRDRWQQNGGGDLVTSPSYTDSIFFLPQPRDSHPHPKSRQYQHTPLRYYDLDPLYKNDPGYEVTRSPPVGGDQREPRPRPRPRSRSRPRQDSADQPHSPLAYQGSHPLLATDTQPLMPDPRPRSRSHPSEHSHRFPSDPDDPRSPKPGQGQFGYPPPPHGYTGSYRPPHYPHHPHPHYPYPYGGEGGGRRSPQSRRPSSQPPPPYRSSGGSGGDDYPPKPARGTYNDGVGAPGAGRGPETGYHPHQRGYDGPFQSFQSEDDDVFPPGSLPHSSHPHHQHPHQAPPPSHAPPSSGGRQGAAAPLPLPRHSSMKPGAQQTYLTSGADGDEVNDGEGGGGDGAAPLFGLEDISSVLDPPQDQSSLLHQHPHHYIPSSSTLPPPRRSWQPSQESSRSNQPPSFLTSQDSGTGEGDRGRGREKERRSSGGGGGGDRPLARVWPSPKSVADDSSDSSGRPLGYTRDQLHDVVDRLRQAPRSRSAPDRGYLDVSSQQQPGRGATPPHPRELGPPHPSHHPPEGHPPPPPRAGYPGRFAFPEDTSSSGLGSSRNTSHSTSGSLRPRGPGSASGSGSGSGSGSKPGANSLSSLLTPSLAEDSSSHYPLLDHPAATQFPGSLRRDTSADENYEFDDLPALESDILDDLQRYSRLAGRASPPLPPSGDGGMLRELYPKPRRPSEYADSAERFQKLREEFQQFRQQQEGGGEGDGPPSSTPPYSGPQQYHQAPPPPYSPHYSQHYPYQHQQPLYAMDSEML